jgi:SAM-dependent methyltransferase
MSGDGLDELEQTQYFGELRDFWWNLDHLELCARRLGFGDVRSVLDVGAGVGHWGRLLGRVLRSEVSVAGIDREPRWVEEATRRAAEAGLGDRYSYRQASAEALPFEDESFDLVTCQTVLIHVPDARKAIREMVRVTKRGGLVVASEPNNHAVTLSESSVNAGAPVEARADHVNFHLTCERGKTALGEGNNSVGELVPGYMKDEGLEEIRVYLGDKAFVMVPPYDSEEQRVVAKAYAEEAEYGAWGWSRGEARRYYLAGGGREGDFDAGWERRMAEFGEVVESIGEGTFSTAGAQILCLVAGRRPA